MNRLVKNMFVVMVIAILLSFAVTSISQACHSTLRLSTGRLVTSEAIYNESDPNIPEDCPEMVPESLWSIEDPNDEPDTTPEMVPGNVIAGDPNDAEMVPFI